jgi:ubiquitin-protein ligase E3 C
MAEDDSTEVQELLPGGANIAVTNDNRLRYVYYVANYRLNTQIDEQSRAFAKGLSIMLELRWLNMFDTVSWRINRAVTSS